MWRFSAAFFALCILFTLVILRLFYWQVISYGRLSQEASNQHYFKLNLPAKRGEIFDYDNSPLVVNKTAYLVYAEPKKITDPAKFAHEIAPILGTEEQDVKDRISQEGIVWATLARKTDEEKVNRLKELNLTGLGFEKEGTRWYPEASLAAQLLGFVASDSNGGDKGYFGIEGYYHRELAGREGYLIQEKDAQGAPILLGEEERVEPEDGRSLVLYLDKTVQRIIEAKLDKGIQKYGAKEGTVVVLDPKTGGILGMAANPSYDPAHFLEYPKELYRNPVVGSEYEPGSTFKVLVMSATLNENAVKPDTKFEESGPVQIGEYTIKTWNEQYHGTQTMTEILQYSSNVGMVFVGSKLGKDKFVNYIDAFGFGKRTTIDLEDEVAPQLRKSTQWREIDLATASFGQGIAVTPIQMVTAVAALANDGRLMEPHVVRKIIDPKGKVIDTAPKLVRKVVAPTAARTITEMMVHAVDFGEAKWAKPKGYRIAGKTGTAQIPVAGHYDSEKTIASFVGFTPADTPKFVMLVTLREPTSSPWGSETAAPLFFDIARELFVYYGIAPTN